MGELYVRLEKNDEIFIQPSHYFQIWWLASRPMKNSTKAKILRRVILAGIALLAVTILWTRIVPIGASPQPFLLASVDEGHRIPDRPYQIYYNDAGAMHSGNFWTWIVKDYGVFKVVVAEGYSTTSVRRGEVSMPIRQRKGGIQVGFTKRHKNDTVEWVDLP